MQGFPSLQRFSPLKLPTFPPPQCHLPTFSGDGEGWQISLSDYNFQVPSVAHHLGSEAFQPAEPSGGCRLPHHRSDLHPDRITAAPAGENILACNQVPLLSAGLTVLCCKRLGKSIKSSPRAWESDHVWCHPCKFYCSSHTQLLQRELEETWEWEAVSGEWAFKLSSAFSLLPIYSILILITYSTLVPGGEESSAFLSTEPPTSSLSLAQTT